MQNLINMSSTPSSYNSQLHFDLVQGNWDGLHRTALEWMQAKPDQPVATFIKNIACLFINPPNIIQNKQYLESVGNKDWKAVLSWFDEFQSETDGHNPYYQVLGFILEPQSKKRETIDKALAENPNNAELLFLQAISLDDRNASIEKLKLAVENKPEFPAALYLIGIFSLQVNQVQAAVEYLNKAVKLSPDFLEAHYQLGSLYSLYIPDGKEQAVKHFQKVIELDPEGGAGRDAKKVLESNSAPQYGQRIDRPATRRGNISFMAILIISLLTTLLFSGPIANFLKITSPVIGIIAGALVFIGLYSVVGRRK